MKYLLYLCDPATAATTRGRAGRLNDTVELKSLNGVEQNFQNCRNSTSQLVYKYYKSNISDRFSNLPYGTPTVRASLCASASGRAALAAKNTRSYKYLLRIGNYAK